MGRRSEPVLPLVLFVIGLYVCIWYGAVYMAMTAKKALNPKDGKKKDTKGAVVASVVSLVCFATTRYVLMACPKEHGFR
jgi:formate-dependent nitrite reductase membrane component NrfD